METKKYEKIRKEIKKELDSSIWTYEQLSDIMGIEKTKLYRVVNGKMKKPNIEVLMTIAIKTERFDILQKILKLMNFDYSSSEQKYCFDFSNKGSE